MICTISIGLILITLVIFLHYCILKSLPRDPEIDEPKKNSK